MTDDRCPFCGNDSFEFREGETYRWLWITCNVCLLAAEVRKADRFADCTSPGNKEAAVREYCEIANDAIGRKATSSEAVDEKESA